MADKPSHNDDPFVFTVDVQPDWVDANGHMNVAFYVLAFDKATDAFYDQLGLSWDYLDDHNHSLFTLGMNVDYVQEVFEGDPLRITTQLLDWDAKRLHYAHQMFHAQKGYLAATNEALAIHVSMETRRSTPFDEAMQAKLTSVFEHHKSVEAPEFVGRTLGIRRG